MTTPRSLYLAGPDVFLANAVDVGRRKQALCTAHGFAGLYPLDQDVTFIDAGAIFRANVTLMRRADAGLFNLSPFRGPSVDAGTAFELGFMFALGKPVFGYSSTGDLYVERVNAGFGPLIERDGQQWARDGFAVEGFRLLDNLMITESIRERGGDVCVAAETGPESLAAFRAFELALGAIRHR